MESTLTPPGAIGADQCKVVRIRSDARMILFFAARPRTVRYTCRMTHPCGIPHRPGLSGPVCPALVAGTAELEQLRLSRFGLAVTGGGWAAGRVVAAVLVALMDPGPVDAGQSD